MPKFQAFPIFFRSVSIRSIFKHPLAVICLLIILSVSPERSSAETLVLSDGSTIQAEVLSFSDGIYKIHSDTLGIISLPKSKIRSIQSGAESPVPTGNLDLNSPQVKQQAEELKNQMMNDPETMRMISNLQNDPSVQGILQDKNLMQAIGQGDMNKIGQDPKIRSLMNSKSVGEILDRHGK